MKVYFRPFYESELEDPCTPKEVRNIAGAGMIVSVEDGVLTWAISRAAAKSACLHYELELTGSN